MNTLNTPRTIITGTGRAGTSLLMEIFTRMNFDTGFDSLHPKKPYIRGADAGFEAIPKENGPKFAKAIELTDKIGHLVEKGYVIERVIVPMRDLDQAIKSRAAIGDHKSGKPGALLTERREQSASFLEKHYRLCLDCARNYIPVYFLAFPEFARDFDYFYAKMCEIFGPGDVAKWEREWFVSVDERKIHRY